MSSWFIRCGFALAALQVALAQAQPAASDGAAPQEMPAPASTPYVAPDYIRKTPMLPPHLSRRKPLPLSLHDAIAVALRQNLALSLSREQVRLVSLNRLQALAAFEPQLRMSGSRSSSQSPPATAQEGTAGQVLLSTQYNWNLGLSGTLPTGTQISAQFANSRSDSTLGTAVAPLLYRSNLILNVSQPLLRGFAIDGRIQWAGVLRADFDSESAKETGRLRAMMTVRSTEDAYWTLVESWKGYEVSQGALELAEKQLELTRRQIGAGVLPESDLINVEGTLAQRQVALLRTEAQIDAAADVLRTLMNLPAADWDRPILPLDAPSFVHVDLPIELAMTRAQDARPELKQSRIELRQIALDLEVARNRRLPQLSLQGGVGTVGQDADYGKALEQAGNGSSFQWNVGMDFSWAPLGIDARAAVRRMESALRTNGLSREKLLVEIRAQLRGALRSIDTAQRQLYAAAKARDLSERSLDVEQRRFLNGMSNNFMVAQRQSDVAQARLAELSALIQHEKARSELQLAMGDLLESRRLNFQVRMHK